MRVFVLGAGASRHAGYPLTSNLLGEVVPGRPVMIGATEALQERVRSCRSTREGMARTSKRSWSMFCEISRLQDRVRILSVRSGFRAH